MTNFAMKNEVLAHAGVFRCTPRGTGTGNLEVQFAHIATEPGNAPNHKLKSLNDFYSIFGSLRLYFDEVSGDSAFYIAKDTEWAELRNHYNGWLEIFDDEDEIDDEEEDETPDWIRDCLVIGEIPHSGNYLVVPVEGDKAGYIFEFEHDGLYFEEQAKNLIDFVKTALRPTAGMLTNMASHMAFANAASENQWWIDEMEDSNGYIVKTDP